MLGQQACIHLAFIGYSLVRSFAFYLPQEEGSGGDKGGEAGPLQLQAVWRGWPEYVTGAEVGVRYSHHIDQHGAWLPQLHQGMEPAGNLLPLSSRQLGFKEGEDDKLAAEEGEVELPLL